MHHCTIDRINHMCISNLSYATTIDLEAFPTMREIYFIISLTYASFQKRAQQMFRVKSWENLNIHSYDPLDEDINAEKL